MTIFPRYVTSRFKDLKVGISSYSEDRTALEVIGNVGVGTTNPDVAVGTGNTAKLAVGVATANNIYAKQYFGDENNNFNALGAGSGQIGIDSGANRNILIGQETGKLLTTGNRNILMGLMSGCDMTTASNNIGFGYNSLRHSVSGSNNVAIGRKAGRGIITGHQNIYLGESSGTANTGGSCNIGIGYLVDYGGNIHRGSENTLIGKRSGSSNFFSGDQDSYVGNTFIGGYSGSIAFTNAASFAATTARFGCNVLLGYNAGRCFGADAGYVDVVENVYIGPYSACRNYGGFNVLLGSHANTRTTGAGQTSSVGNLNIGIGHSVCLAKQIGNRQLAIGHSDFQWIHGDSNYNVGIGITDPSNAVTSSDTQKLAVGILTAHNVFASRYQGDENRNFFAGEFAGSTGTFNNTAACLNVAIGNSAGSNLNASGSYVANQNVLIGACVGTSMTTSCYNTVVGAKAGISITNRSAYSNVLLGFCAGRCVTGSRNIAIGQIALDRLSTNSSGNIGIGYKAGRNTESRTTRDNISIGQLAGDGAITGCRNTFLGHYAGRNMVTGDGGTMLCNMILGSDAGAQIQGSHEIFENVLLGSRAGYFSKGLGITTAFSKNVLIGACAGRFIAGSCNIYIGPEAAATYNGYCHCGVSNIGIGQSVQMPDRLGSNQLAIGQTSQYWITGDQSFNVGIGSTIPQTKLDVGGALNVSGLSTFGGATQFRETVTIGRPHACEPGVPGQFAIHDGNSMIPVKMVFSGGSLYIDPFLQVRFGQNTNYLRFYSTCSTLDGGRAGRGNIQFGYLNGEYGEKGLDIFGHGSLIMRVANKQAVGIGSTLADVTLSYDGDPKLTTNGIGVTIFNQLDTTDLNVAGVSTFAGAIDANGTLDVDGHTELDDVNVSGVATFAGSASFEGNVSIAGTLTYEDVTNVDSIGIITAGHGLRVTKGGINVTAGISTFGGNIDANGNLDVDGQTDLDILNVSETATFSALVDVNNRLDVVGGANVDQLNVSGVSTFVGILTATNIFADRYHGDQNNNFYAGPFVGSGAAGITSGATANIGIGLSLGTKISSGYRNILFGVCSGPEITTGNKNILIGCHNARILSTGQQNIALGARSLDCMSTGSYNIAMGFRAGRQRGCLTNPELNDQNYSVMIGYNAGDNTILKGCRNTFLGDSAGKNMNTDNESCVQSYYGNSNNTMVGSFAGIGINASGLICENTIIGDQAGSYAAGSGIGTDYIKNVLIGSLAGAHTRGSCNIYVGPYAGCTVSGNFNAGIGEANIGIGLSVQLPEFRGSNQLAIGQTSQYWITGDQYFNVGIGSTTPQGKLDVGGTIFGDQLNVAGVATAGIVTATNIFAEKYQGDIDRNIVMGRCAGIAITPASTETCHNVILGDRAGEKLYAGDSNVFIGCQAGIGATGSSNNIFIGKEAGANNYVASSCGNIAIGHKALCHSPSNQNAIAIGCCAGFFHSTSHLVAIGCWAGKCSPNPGIYIGTKAGENAGAGSHVLIGYNAGRAHQTPGNYSVMIGNNSGCGSRYGCSNVFLGGGSAVGNYDGSCNIAIGRCSGPYTVNEGNGHLNFSGGWRTGSCLLTGNYNTFIGVSAGVGYTSGSNNISIGSTVGPQTCGASGNYNIAFGHLTGSSITSGSDNIAVGRSTGFNVTSGCENILFGNCVGAALTTGQFNVFLGAEAGRQTVGNCNVLIGRSAGCDIQTAGCSSNIGIGCRVFMGETGGYNNIAIGGQAGRSFGYTAGNSLMISIGLFAGRTGLTTSIGNISIGCRAGEGVNSYTTCNNHNIMIGDNAGQSTFACHVNTNIFIGCRSGYFLQNGPSDKVEKNILIGTCAFTFGKGACNIFLGSYAAAKTCNSPTEQYGDANIGIGVSIQMPNRFGSNQLAIGQTSQYWITGDESFNVGIGSTTPQGKLDVGGTIVSDQLNVSGVGTFNGRVGVNTDILRGVPALDINLPQDFSGQTLSYAGEGGVGLSNLGNKTFPNASGFRSTLGLKQCVEIGGTQTIDSSSPGGFPQVHGMYNFLIKNKGNVQNVDRLQFIGFYNQTQWLDQNTLRQYRGIEDVLYYGGANANGKTSSFFEAGVISLSPEDGKTQTINNIIGKRTTIRASSGIATVTIGQTWKGHQTQLQISAGSGRTTNASITNAVFYNTSDFWGTSGSGTKNATIQNLYGLKLNPPSGADGLVINNNYGIYQGWSNASNYFAGNVGVGTTIATNAVSIGNTAKLAVGILTAYQVYANQYHGDSAENFYVGLTAGGGAASVAAGGDTNIAIGAQNGCNLTSGSCNILLGRCVGISLTTGSRNISMGHRAGNCLTTGEHNIFLGSYAGCTLNTGGANIAIGREAGVTSGLGTVFNGTSNSQNISVGDEAGRIRMAGTGNIAIGRQSGYGAASLTPNGTNDHNIFIGCHAGNNIGNLNYGGCNTANNIMIGKHAGRNANRSCSASNSLNENVMIGLEAGYDSHGACNIYIGSQAVRTCQSTMGVRYSGDQNIGIGQSVNLPKFIGSNQLAIGQCTNYWITGDCDYNVGIGITNPSVAVVGAGSTQKLAAGIVTAYNLFAEGVNISGVSTFAGTVIVSGANEIGIGTNNPADPLHIFSSEDGQLRLESADNGAVYQQFYRYNSGTSTRISYFGFGGTGNDMSLANEIPGGDILFKTTPLGASAGAEENALQIKEDKSVIGYGDLNIAGVSTFVGVVTTSNDLFSGGDIFIRDSKSLRMGNENDFIITHRPDLADSTFITQSNISAGTQLVTMSPSITLQHNDGRKYFKADESTGIYHPLVGTAGKIVLETNGIGVTVYNQLDTTDLNVAGVSTFSALVDVNNRLDVVGGANVDQLNVSGVSTFVGVTTFQSPVFIGAGTTLNSKLLIDKDIEIFSSGQIVRFKIPESSPNAILTYIDAPAVQIGRLSTEYATFNSTYSRFKVNNIERLKVVSDGIEVSGVTDTLGLNVTTGVSTFKDDVEFHGVLGVSSITFDKSDNSLKFKDTARLRFGNDNRLQIYYQDNVNYIMAEKTPDDIEIGTHGGDIIFETVVGSQKGAEVKYNSSVDLYYKNVKRLATSGVGATIYHQLDTTDLTAIGGNFTGIVTASDFVGGGINTSGTSTFTDEVILGGLTVSGVSTFAGLVDINAGGQANTFKVEDLTSGRVVLAGTGGELEDSANLTFNGSTLGVTGNASFSGDVSIGGTLTYEDVTNIDSVGLITARSGLKVLAGGADITGHTNLDNVSIAGVSTFSSDLNIAENIVHTGDTDTKISFPSNDTIKLEAAGNTITVDNSKNTFNRPIRVGDYIAHSGVDAIGVKFFNQGTGNNNTYIGLGAEDNGTSGGINHKTFRVFRQGSSINRVNIDNFGNLNALQGFSVAGISTFTGNIDANGTLDVDGDTQLDDLNVAGVATFSSGLKVGTGITFESTGNAYVTGITTLGIGATGEVYLYNPANSALSATTNDVYGWKAKTYCSGLQVNSAIYLSRSGSNGLSLGYNNATGSTITAHSGFLKVGVPYGGDFNLYGNNIYLKDRLQTKNFAHFEKVSGTEYRTHLYGGDNAIKLSTANDGVHVTGVTSTTNLNVAGVSTFAGDINANGNIIGDDSTNISGINSVTATEYYGTGAIGSNLFRQDAQCNLLAGCNTGIAITTGENNAQQNVLLGRQVGRRMICGCDNVLIGNNILCRPHRGRRNVMLGHNVGSAFTTLAQVSTNVFIGRYTAASQQANVSNSIAIGLCAARCGTNNSSIIMGTQAGMGVQGQTHSNNIFLGSSAGMSISTGGSNIVMGSSAGKCICCASNNIYLGSNAGRCDFRGCGNIALGTNALCMANVGQQVGGKPSCNIALGVSAGTAISSGDHNFLGGTHAGCSLVSGSYNVAIGNENIKNQTTGNYSIALGYKAAMCVTSGSGNMAFGFCSLFNTTTGGCNFGIGNRALQQMTTGCFNVAMGGCVGLNMTEGCRNIFFGDQAACAFVSGDNNIAMGCRVCVPLDTGSNQLAFGNRCCYWLTGDSSYNVGIGSTIPQARLDVFGGAKIDQLNVTGVSTFAGITTNTGTLFANQLNVAGVSTFNDNVVIISDKNLGVGDLSIKHFDSISVASITLPSGQIITQTDGFTVQNNSGQKYIKATSTNTGLYHVGTQKLRTSTDGVQVVNNAGGSLGTMTALNVDTTFLKASGVSTFKDDVEFHGVSGVSSITFDKSDNSLKFVDQAKLKLGDSDDLQIFHSQGANYIKAVNLQSLNFATNNTNRAMFESGGHFRPIVDSTYDLGIDATRWRNVYADTYYGCGGIGSRLFQNDVCGNLIAGTNAGLAVTTTNSVKFNILIGCDAGSRINTSCYTVAIGKNAAKCMTGGSGQNTAVGSNAGQKMGCCGGTGNANTFLGFNAGNCGYNPTANTYIGHNAGLGHPDSTGGSGGSCNVAVGFNVAANIRGGNNNVLLGRYVGSSISTATNNFASGNFALACNLSGGSNITIGGEGLGKNITGGSNVALGCRTLFCNTTGSFNVAIGYKALNSNSTNNGSIAIGCAAGFEATCGPNIMIGGNAGYNLNECNNTFIGQSAGNKSTDATGNTFIGHNAGICNTTGDANTSVGCKAGIGNTTGNANISIGHASGSQNCGSTGAGNLSIGHFSARNISSGLCNISIGECAACDLSTGGCNIAIGQDTGKKFHSSSQNIAIGRGIAVFSNVTGGDNVLMGTLVARRITSGAFNTFIGASAGRYVTSASGNIGVGAQSSYCIGSGNYNIALGACSNRFLTVGLDNIAIGRCSGYLNTTTHGNVSIGHSAGYGVAGANNVSIGSSSGSSASATGDDNIYVGKFSGANITTGHTNVFLGPYAGRSTASSSANNNIGIGMNVGKCLTTGFNNIFFGKNAGLANTGGKANIFMGLFSGTANAGGSNNHFIGGLSGMQNTSGKQNNFMGFYAGAGNTSGNYNLFFGSAAAINNTTGSCTIAIGHHAARCQTTANATIAVGHCAGAGNTITGSDNILVGRSAGFAITTAFNNIFMGVCAGANTGIGTENTFIGTCAGLCNTDGYRNVFIGHQAGKCSTTGVVNVAIGNCAGCAYTNNNTNTSVGPYAGMKLCSGSGNTLLGTEAGTCLNTGGCNTVVGRNAARYLISGSHNNIFGHFAGCKLNTGSQNLLMGNCAGYCLTGNQNVMLGQSAGFNRSGNKYQKNVIVGHSAGSSAGTLAVGNMDVLIGWNAGCNYTGSCSIGIGHSVCLPIADGQNQLAIGQYEDRWIVGTCDFNVGIGITTPTSKLHVGGDAVIVGVVTATDFDATSDIRLKTNIKPIDDPIAKVIQIEGVSFNWKKDNQPALGVIADQVEKILPELVHGDDPKTVNYNGLIGLLIEVVKDQQNQINTLNERISKLE